MLMIMANIKIAAMKKIFRSIMFIAAAAMVFASCQKEENVAPETISATLTMHANVDATKTYLGDDNTVLWGAGEAVKLYVGVGETSKFVSSTPTDAYDGEASASFSFAIEGIEATGPYALGGVYPASAAMSDNSDPTKFKTILPQTQNAEIGKYDPSAYIMALKPETVDILPTEYTASFRRATALNKITLTNVAEDVTTVEITVPEGKYLAGRRYFDLTTGESGEIYYDQSSTITVNSAFTGNSIDVWFCSWGVELAAEEELTVTMKSAAKVYKRTIAANENGIKFVEGGLNTLKINMASATVENVGDFGGKWLITGTASDKTYAAKAYSSGNNLSSPVQITVAEDDSITEVDGLDQCVMTFTKITEGDYKGMYTIQDAGGKYLYAAAPSSNHLKGNTTATTENYYWTVECNNGAYSIIASKSTNRNVMQFNYNSGSPIFSCYASASQTPVKLYPYSNVKPDTTPKIVIDGETTKNIGYEGGEVTFNYTLKNLEEQTLNIAVSNTEMLSASAVEGVVTITVAANEGEEREATITLTCGDAAEVVLTVTQDKYVEPGQGGDTNVVVLSEQFDNTTTSDSSTAIGTSKFPNFSGATSKAYTSKYGGIKLGASGAIGYITSKSLDLSSAFTVQIDACKYGSDTGNIQVTVGGVTKTINNSELGAAGSFKTFTLSFDAATANSTVKIATSSKRAYIDNVVITRN